MAGFIYVASNPSFIAGRVKIGKSDKDPEGDRMDELYSTGVPERFEVEYSALVDNHHKLERFLHYVFNDARVSRQREFFDVSVEEVVDEIRKERATKILREMTAYVKKKVWQAWVNHACEKCSTTFAADVHKEQNCLVQCPKCYQMNLVRHHAYYGSDLQWKEGASLDYVRCELDGSLRHRSTTGRWQ